MVSVGTTSDVPGAECGGAGMARGPLPPPPPQQRAPEAAAPQPGSRCFTCNEAGHYARDCPKKRRTGGELPKLSCAEEMHEHQKALCPHSCKTILCRESLRVTRA